MVPRRAVVQAGAARGPEAVTTTPAGLRRVVRTRSARATEALGERIGRRLQPGDVVALVGPVGAGKTVLARGLARGAGAHGYVASPSFVIVREYAGPVPVRHVDLYRLERPEDVEAAGLEDVLVDDAIAVVEWADRAPWVLPADHLRIDCALGRGARERVFTLSVPARRADVLTALDG